jgi:type I restriction enzyme S subunit
VSVTEKCITDEGVANSSTKWAGKYDIVTASAGQGRTRGQTSMLLLDTCVNQSVIVTHAEKKYMPFLFFNISGRYEELRVLSDGTSTRGSLTTKIMAKLMMPDVSEHIIDEFAEFAWPIIDKIQENQNETSRLIDIRDTILPKLMSGELDISNLDI